MINIENLSAYQRDFILSALEKVQTNDNSNTVYRVAPECLYTRYGVSQEDIADFMTDMMDSKIGIAEDKQFSFFREIGFENMMLYFRMEDEAFTHKDEIHERLAEGNSGEDFLEILQGYNESFGADYEDCWETTNYDGQSCPLCPHCHECSGYEDRD